MSKSPSQWSHKNQLNGHNAETVLFSTVMSNLETRIQHGSSASASASISTGVTRGVKRTAARSSTTRPAHVNVEYFAKYFKDPPNANDILNRVFRSTLVNHHQWAKVQTVSTHSRPLTIMSYFLFLLLFFCDNKVESKRTTRTFKTTHS